MKTNNIKASVMAMLCCQLLFLCHGHGQGTFQNLDFENGIFIPIPGDPFGRVQFGPAMPGWTGYVGTNQIDWILHNNQFISSAGISIFGPDFPSADIFHEDYYLYLQTGFDLLDPTRTVTPSIVQNGVIPASAQSIRLLYGNSIAIGVDISFKGTSVPLYNLGISSNGRAIWGGDISPFQGQTGELRLFGSGSLDFIQFSDQRIPEPSTVGLFALGALLLGWRLHMLRKP